MKEEIKIVNNIISIIIKDEDDTFIINRLKKDFSNINLNYYKQKDLTFDTIKHVNNLKEDLDWIFNNNYKDVLLEHLYSNEEYEILQLLKIKNYETRKQKN